MASKHASNPHRSAIARARAGDRLAFDALYERAIAAVWQAVAAASLPRAEAEAITAMVLREAFDALHDLPDDLDFTQHCLRLLTDVSERIAPFAADTSAPADS